MLTAQAGNDREVAQAGSASGLGPEGRRFESCLPDLKEKRSSKGSVFLFYSALTLTLVITRNTEIL